MSNSARKLRTKSVPHLLLSTLLYAPQPWVRRRVNYSAGVIHVDVVPARLRDRLATNYSRLGGYVQWLVDRGLAANVRRSKQLLQLDLILPKDHG